MSISQLQDKVNALSSMLASFKVRAGEHLNSPDQSAIQHPLPVAKMKSLTKPQHLSLRDFKVSAMIQFCVGHQL